MAERLEDRRLMAADMSLDEQLAGQTPDYYYKVDGQPKGLVVHPQRVALQWKTSDIESEQLASGLGLSHVRALDSAYRLYESTSGKLLDIDALRNSGFIEDVAPVFVETSSKSQVVLLDELIVNLTPGVTAEAYFAGRPQFSSYRPLAGTPDQYVAKVAKGSGTAALETLQSIQGDLDLDWVEPNFYQDWRRFFTPNDPRFGNQWHLHNTGQSGGVVDADSDLPEAWDVIQGGSTSYTIGVIDDGVISNHPDLTIWVNPGEVAGDGIDNDGNGWVDDINGWNFVANNNQSGNTNAADMHGTSVAGVAAAKGNNGIGVAGASYGSKVLSAKIFEGSAVASDASIASALYYAAGRKANGSGTWKSADVLNNSWGGGASSSVINAALTWATTAGRQGAGAPVFIATGNEFGAVSEPALRSLTIPGVFAVGAINNKAEKSDYSNFGPAVDLVTPSSDTRAGYLAIDTTDRPGAAGYDPSDYTGTGANGFGGTSSATPLASGIAALTLARADQVGVTLTPVQLRSYLRNNTDIVGSAAYSMTTGRNDNMGYGRLNAGSAVSNLGKAEISVISSTRELLSGASTVDFGTVTVNSTSDITLRVRNQGTSTLNLSSLTVGGGSFAVQTSFGSTSLAIGASTAFVLRYQPTAEGSSSSTVTIGSNDSDEALFTFIVSGAGTAQPSSTSLQLGDVAFTGYQATAPDKVSFVALKSIASGTVLTITDNAWNGSALATSEGNSVITFSAAFAAGTQFNYDATRAAGSRWAVGSATAGLSDVTSSNFALNAGGDNLFAYLGNIAPVSGSDSVWLAGFASSNFVASGGSSTASLTLLPSAMTLGDTAFSLGLANGASNQNGAMISPASVTGNAAQIRSVINTIGNWTTYTSVTGSPAIPPNIVFTIGAGGNNNAPTALDLSSTSVAENAGVNAVVGTLTTTDPDVGNTFTYTLVSGTGSTDNSLFNISGNSLRANASFDFEARNSYSVRIRTTDQGGLSYERAFTISVTDVPESLTVKLNELKVNPPGSTTAGDKYQYVELRGNAGEALTNVYVVSFDGNGANAGRASYVASLNNRTLGSNGLLMIKSPTGGHNAASGTTVVTDSQFDSAGGILSKQTVSFYLVTASGPMVQGTDYDTNNDGTLDNLPAGFTVLDSVGWSDGDAGDRVYGGVALTQTQGTPDAATRVVGTTNTAVASWFNGDLFDVGNDPAQLLYDSTRGSSNLPTSPVVASLTPGEVNFAPAATSGALRIVSYNITSAGGAPRAGLSTILQAIGTEIVSGLSRPIDLLAMQEVLSQATTSTIVAGLLNSAYSTVAYVASSLDGGTTGAGTQGFVYNTQTLSLLEEVAVGSTSASGAPRQTIRAKFRPSGTFGSADFYVFNSHFKSADSNADEARRLVEAQAIRDSADALGEGANILYVGDFNLYKASDPSFVELTSAGNGQAFDPISRVGAWSGNSGYVDVFTQAPSMNPPSGLTGGGLDDRFDFQLISGELRDGQGLEYRSGSYRAFGNNGSVPLNGNINSPSSTALAGLSNRTTVLDLLTTVSDHLPVVADYTFTIASSANRAPSGSDKAVSINEDATYTYIAADFGFSDPDGNTLQALKISSLPAAGYLRLNNMEVTLNQFVSISDISAGSLRFIPVANASGMPYSTWTFQVQDNGGTTGGGIDLDPSPNTITMNVTPVNDAPDLVVSVGSSAFSGNPIAVDPSLIVADIDSPTLVGATVRITTNFSSDQDQLLFTGSGGVTGSFNASTGVLTLTGVATPEVYQTILRTVSYNNTSGAPTTAPRTVAFQVDDAAAANNLSNIASRDVTVTASSQPPNVTNITVNTTGVVVNFNKPINSSVINLYDQNGALGAADVTLVGNATGPVLGTLVFNSTNTGFTFVKTGSIAIGQATDPRRGLLEPDTYTLRLRSDAATGFSDSTGNALLNNAGSPGDYVHTFTVDQPPAAAITISIPDFARGFSQAVNVPNTSAGLPVVLSSADNISVVDFSLTYDPTLLTITGFNPTNTSASTVINVSTPGIASVSIVSTSPLTTQAGLFVLGTFVAKVPDAAPYAAKQVIRIANVEITDSTPAANTIPALIDNAVHIAAFFGDTSGNQVYGGNDALLVQRNVVGTNSGFSAFQMADPVILGDISSNAEVGGNDALFIQRAVVGASAPAIPALPSGIIPPPPTGPDPRLFIPTDLTAVDVDTSTPGVQIDIPLRLLVTEATGITIAGVDFSIAYDPSKLTITNANVSVGPLLSGSNLLGAPFSGAVNVSGGLINVSQGSNDGTVRFPLNTLGDLYRIRATIVDGATGTARLNLRATGTAIYDNNIDTLTLVPAPTNADTDTVDGLLTISVASNNAPVFNPNSYSFNLAENSLANTAVGQVTATDPDPGTTLTYSLSGIGAANFVMNASTGAITVAAGATLDFEGTNVFNLTATASDGALSATAPVTISLTNVNETPTDIVLSTASIAENAGANAQVGTFSTSDPDAGSTFTYTLVSGAGSEDNAAFNISGNSLRATSSLDFETKSSFAIRVRSTDQGLLQFEKTFTITVTNVNDPPAFSSGSYSFSLAENSPAGTAVGSAPATDQDAGTTLTYSLSGTGASSFEISSSGAVTVAAGAVLDFEATPSYNLTVSASDGTLITSVPMSISLSNVKESRLFIPSDLTTTVDADPATPGIQIDIPVRMQVIEGAGQTVAGVDLSLAYDPTKLSIASSGVVAGPLLSPPNLRGAAFAGAVNVTGGLLNLSVSSNDGTISFPFGTVGDLYRIRATVVDGATGTSRLNVRSTGTAIYDNDIDTLALVPPPTNADTDTIDGLVTFSGTGTPNVTLSVNNTSIAEAAGVATFTVTLSAVSGLPVTVDLGFSGTATLTTDYTRSGTQIVIPAGSLSGSITVTAVQDTLDETDETVIVDITSVTNGNEATAQQATTSITDDDAAPNVTLAVNNASIAEAAGVATFTATLSAVSGLPVTVDLGFSGTATLTTDYTRSGTQIVIPAGSLSGSITVTAVQDALDEADETVIVDITSVTNGNEATAQQATTSITDDDAAPNVTLAVNNTSIAEAAGVATFTVTLSAVSGLPVTVDLGFSGTATLTTDYTRSGTQIVIPAGSLSGSITVTAVQDTLDETDETVIVDITSVTNGNEATAQQATTSITDDDAAPNVTLAVNNASIAEAAGVATFTATLSAVSGLPVTVDLGFSGTATLTTDYTRSGTQIVIPAGSLSGSITVTAVQDTLDETDETVIVDITSVTNGNEATAQQATTSITDDDAAPNVTLAVNNTSIAEAAGVATFTVTLSAVSGLPVTVDLGFSGTATLTTDYTRSGTQIVIPAGSLSGSITVTAVQDTLDETDETVIVDITSVTNGNEATAQQATTSITDDDAAPNVTLAVNNASIAEAAGVATFTATLSAVSGLPVTVDLGFSGTATLTTDYTRSGTQIVIPAGSLSGSITVTAVQDTLDEADETVIVDITSVTNGNEATAQQATTSITDDDAAPNVTLSVNNASIAEAAGVATFTVTLSAVSGLPVTVDLGFSGTATLTTDYTRSGTQIVIPAGSLSGSITVTAVQDTLDEADETVIVDITSVTNGNEATAQQATTSITDDDAASGSAPRVSGNLSFNGGTAQRSTVRDLTINFDLPVSVEPDAFIIRRRANATLGITAATITYVMTQISPTQVRLTFVGPDIIGGSLSDGQYDLTIIANRVQSDGVILDGDGDGVAGGDFQSRAADNFFRLFGDSNGDAIVDAVDTAAFNLTLFKTTRDAVFNSAFDWDGDGDVDAIDYRFFRTRVGRRFS